jgi:hypothetical protein
VVTVRALHLLFGVGGVLAFLGTGAWMATHFPGAYEANESVRYLYRANHVYLLLASLVNLGIGIYRTAGRAGWRGRIALAAPLLLFYAFFVEPPRAVPERPATLIGAGMLLVGVLAQWPNRARRDAGRA